ncbi:type IV secretion system DNA-binding domain-containing protein, partial [Acidithiobacillus ferridurans]|uniref:type IV secretion system DNA-binding domain-containing protein n=1 Tax=Acidithiobacillus ferridurans TaxID=1232575 RepID=UPI001C07B12D
GIFDKLKSFAGDPDMQKRVKNAVATATAAAAAAATQVKDKADAALAKADAQRGEDHALADRYLQQAKKIAERDSEEQHLRGSVLQDLSASHQQQKLLGLGTDQHIRIGNVPISDDVEQQHFLLAGAPGTGKSVSIAHMLKTIRARGQKCVVFDPAGEFTSAFYRPGQDIILNPLDKRDAGWSPWSDLQVHEFASFAEIIVPPALGQQDPFFAQSAQTVLKCLMRKYDNIDSVLRAAISLPDDDLRGIVEAQGMGGLLGPSKTFQSTRSTLANGIERIAPLHNIASGQGFSFAKWIEDPGDSWVFMPIKKDQQRQMKTVIALYFQTLIMKALSVDPDPQRRIWCVIDEFPSLGKISVLHEGVAEGRKFGLTFVLGLQSIGQVRDSYGKDGAQSIYSMPKTRLILRVSDSETSEEMSKELGERQIIRTKKSESSSSSTSNSGQGQLNVSNSDSTSKSSDHVQERIVLPSEIGGLPDMIGYLRSGSHIVRKVRIGVEGLPPRAGVGSDPRPLRPMPWEQQLSEVEEAADVKMVVAEQEMEAMENQVNKGKMSDIIEDFLHDWSPDLIASMTDEDIDRLAATAAEQYMLNEQERG